jgi:hypothetical protein
MGTVLEALTEAIDAAAATEPALVADAESVLELHRQLARLDAVLTRAVAAFDAGGEWQTGGARSAAAWLAAKTGEPKATGRRRLRCGRALRSMPASEKAWVAGDITAARVEKLASVRRPATEEAFQRDEEMLLRSTRELHFAGFARVVDYWQQRVDDEGAEAGDDEKRDRRSFHLSQTFEGMWVGDLTLDPISGAIVRTRLKGIERELFRADWAAARERLGRDPLVGELQRTPAQRRADALVEMATRAGIAPLHGRRPEPLFTVLVGYETLAERICELEDGTVIAPGSLVPWLDRAWLERVVFGAASRVIDVGAAQRLFGGATRRAVEVRDRECFHDLCDERVGTGDIEIDHVEPWAVGGRTVVANGRVACGFHNRGRDRRRPRRRPP